jgi:hypothetical protein
LSEIEANEKLREAKYFLEQMRRLDFMCLETGMFEDKEFSYNFDGFIVAWHSVLDILRFDFAEKFSLGITRQERASRDYFRHLAEGLASKNPKDFSEAVDFYEWMSRQEDDLLKRHALLLEKRHVIAHRGIVQTGIGEETVERDFAVNVSSAGLTALIGDIVHESSTDSIPPHPGYLPVKIREKRAHTCFKDDPEERSIVSICSSAYRDMAQLVANAEKGSWKAPG